MDFLLSLQTESIRSAYAEDPVAVDLDVPVADVIALMQTERAAAVLVCEDDRLVGVFTERDVLKLLAERADLSAPVSGVMSADPVSVDVTATVGDAIQRMSEGGYRHLPVVRQHDPTQPTGMIDARGVLRYLVEHFPNTIYNLPPHAERATPEREGA